MQHINSHRQAFLACSVSTIHIACLGRDRTGKTGQEHVRRRTPTQHNDREDLHNTTQRNTTQPTPSQHPRGGRWCVDLRQEVLRAVQRTLPVAVYEDQVMKAVPPRPPDAYVSGRVFLKYVVSNSGCSAYGSDKSCRSSCTAWKSP